MSDLQSAVILALIYGAFSWIPGFQGLMFRLTQLAGVYVEPGNPMLIWVGFGFAIGIGCRFILDAYTTLMKLGSAGVRGATEGFFSGGGGGGAQRSAVQSIVIFGVAISIVSLTSYISVYLQALEEYLLLVEDTLAVVGDYLALTLAVLLVFIGVISYRTGRLMRTVARKQVGAPQFLFGAFFFGLLQIIDLRVGIFALVIAFLAAGFSPSLALRIPLFFAIPASLMTGFSLIAGSGGSVLTESVILVLIGVSALSTFIVLSFVFRFTEKLSLGSFSGLIGILILAVSSNILFGFSLAKVGYYALFGIGAVGASIFSFELFTEVSRRHKVKGITTEILSETKRSTEQARIIKAVEANKLTTSTGEIENIAEPMNFMVRQGKVERVNPVVKSVSEKELRQIQGEISDPDPKKRKEASKKLCEIMASLPDLTLKEFSAIKELGAELEHALADDSEWAKYFAVEALSHLFSAYGLVLDTLPDWVTKTVDKLTPLLNDVDLDVRYMTARTIGVIGSIDPEKARPAISQLVKLTESLNNDVRYVTIEALKKIPLPEVVALGLQPIIDRFYDQVKEIRLAAIQAISELYKVAPSEMDVAIEPLKNLQKDRDKDVRHAAYTALSVISPEVAKTVPVSEELEMETETEVILEMPIEKKVKIRPTITSLLNNLKMRRSGKDVELGKVLKVVEEGYNTSYNVSITFKNTDKPLKKVKIIDEFPLSFEITKILPKDKKPKVKKRGEAKEATWTLKNFDSNQTFAVAYTIEGSESYLSKPVRIEIGGLMETGATTDSMDKAKQKKFRLPAIHTLLRKELLSASSDTSA